jgi:hypothetical protein
MGTVASNSPGIRPIAFAVPGAGACARPWEATRLQLVWERVDGLAEAVTPLLEAQGARLERTPPETLALMRHAALIAVTALALGERLSIHAWTLYAAFDPFVAKRGLRPPE